MRNPFLYISFWIGFILLGSSCSEVTETETTGAQIIQIIENSFIPSEITATAGETILIYNQDVTTHWIGSESDVGLFDDTGDLDSGLIPSETPSALVVPEDSVPGDIYYFYDKILTSEMETPDGVITVE